MAENNSHLNDKELRLEILRIVMDSGSDQQKNNPLPIATEYYRWVVSDNNITKKK